MAGHNMCSEVKRLKSASDTMRRPLFDTLAKETTLVTGHGGGNPDANPRHMPSRAELPTRFADARGNSPVAGANAMTIGDVAGDLSD